jgi:pyruvate-ferredoxin/flavodoxin oxidoreductase
MGEGYQYAVANGQRNLWGERVAFIELESEHSAASTCEGFAVAGGRVTNFTSGQGLILMKEVLYTISGKRLPVVFHIGARALTSQGLNVHAGHDDVMGCEDVGWGMIFARNAQEAGDLALVARRVAEATETPVMNIQDGFLTTHTIESVRFPEPEFMKMYVGSPQERLRPLFDVDNPLMSGVVQNQDSYMKGKIAQRYFYNPMLAEFRDAMDTFYQYTGRRYRIVDPYRMEDAEYALVGMGSYMETALATVDYLRDVKGIRVGCVHVTCFRPFPSHDIVRVLQNCRAIGILERMDNPLSQSNPLTREIKAAFSDAFSGVEDYPAIDRIPQIYSGSGGLGSRDVRPGDFIAMLENMLPEGRRQRYFCVGIDHPLCLPKAEDPDLRPSGSFSMRGHSVGGYGSVTTNKVIADFCGMTFGIQVQAYPKYGSEKKGLPTTYYLTVAPDTIRTHCELEAVEFIPCNDVNAFKHGNPLGGIADGGAVFLQSDKTDANEIWDGLPSWAKRTLREKRARVLALDTVKVAREYAPTPDLQMRMQGIVLLGVFLKIMPLRQKREMTDDDLFDHVEKAIRKAWGRKGEAVVHANLSCVRRGYTEVIEVPRDLIDHSDIADDGLDVKAVGGV